MELRFIQCAIQDCSRNAHRDAEGRKGYCSTHYQRIKRHGNSETVLPVPTPARDWLIAHQNYDGEECLKWPFATGKDGYGRAHRFDTGTLSTASRLMCELAYGPPPSALFECAHSCGKGHLGCTNPKHLYWATSSQNKQDKVAHGTDNRGEKSPVAKLSNKEVEQIRSLFPTHINSEIARLFQVDRQTIADIKYGRKRLYG